MPSLFRDAGGTDFDDLFDPYVQGSAPAATGFRTSDGTDLAGRYAPLAYGSKRADVNMRNSAGVDLTNLWAAKGTASYALGFNGQTFFGSAQALTNATGNTSASVSLSIASDGSWTIGNHLGLLASGSWLPAGKSATDYDVQFVTSAANRAVVTSDAPAYANCATTHSVSVRATVVSRSSDSIDEYVSVTCMLRSNTGAVSVTVCSFHVFAQGWL